MDKYIFPFVLALAISYLLAVFIRRIALKYHLTLPIRPRDLHPQPIPRLGGVALWLAFWLVLIVYGFTESKHFSFNFDFRLGGILLASLFLVGIMVIDDLRGLNPYLKLVIQIIAAGLIVWSGVSYDFIRTPFSMGTIYFGALAPVISVLWIIIVVNGINWLDGLDGLATGVTAIAAGILFFLSLKPMVNQPSTALMLAILAGAAIGFLLLNFNPAKIFLGDSGSHFLGLMLATLAIISGGKVATAVLVLGIPLFDAFWVITRRVLHRHSPFYADSRHLHHRFLKIGWGQRRTVLFFYLITIIFGYLALSTTETFKKLIFGLILIGIMMGLAIVLVITEKVKEKKFSKR
jgi:UDP-GlcNAc:undecaprenyl-phosphate GlcNAc-1-phosphate transferase